MEAIIILGIVGGLLFAFFNNCIKFRNRRIMLRMLIENNMLNNIQNDFKFSFEDSSKGNSNVLLPITLGVMGFSLGAFFTFLIHLFIESDGYITLGYPQEQLLNIALPLFFASLGLLVSYFIQQKKSK